MKKNLILGLVAVVVAGCIITAGCTTLQTNTVQPSDNPAVTISLNDINKSGSSYNVGDIVEIRIPSNPTTGYNWVVTTQDSGLDVRQDYIADVHPEGMTGVGGTTIFWLSAENPGNYNFTTKYMRSWDGEESAIATYSDKLIVEEKPDKVSVDGPSLSIVYDTFNINPKAGETVLVKIRGNPTTGFNWIATGDGLAVKDDYKLDDAPEGMVGVPGTYYIYATASKAGKYTLKLTEARGSSDPVTTILIPLIFL